MADYTHMMNLIQGEVQRIKERRHPDHQKDELLVLYEFLRTQAMSVSMEVVKITEAKPPDSQ